MGWLVAAVFPPSQAGSADGLVQGYAFAYSEPTSDLQRVASTGANTVYLDVYWEADSPDADSVHPFSGTTPDTTLISMMRDASAAGLRVVLMPKVWCNGCQYGWRGDLQPSDPHQFMENYGTTMLSHYAQLAEANNVWLLFLGSEMNNLQPYADDWRQIASRVHTLYRGLISYQPNWDRLSDVSFWDALDIVTVSAYFPLTTTERPSVAQLKQSWRSSQVDPWRGQDWFGALQQLAKSTGKGVLIGEVGYRSSTTAAAHPWFEWDTTSTPDQATQANAYEALLETFSSQPWWLGVIWWQWRGTDQDAGSTDMSPKGKQAEQLLTKWWAQGWRPSDEAAPGAGGARTAGAPAGTTSRPGASVKANTITSATAGPTSTAAAQTDSPVTAGAGDGLAVAGASSAPGSPSSLVKLARSSDRRHLPVAIAVAALFAMAAALMSVGLRRVRLPRSATA